MPVGPTPEVIEAQLDRIEKTLLKEGERKQGWPRPLSEGDLTGVIGTWYLSAIHSQLDRLDDSGLLSKKEELRFQFPFVTGEENYQETLLAMVHRFVVAEVCHGLTDELKVRAWQLVGALVEDELLDRKLGRSDEYRSRISMLPFLQRQLDEGDGHLANFRGQVRAAESFAAEGGGETFARVAESLRNALSRFEAQLEGIRETRRHELNKAHEHQAEIFQSGELLAGSRYLGDGDHLNRLRELSIDQLEESKPELSISSLWFLRLVREAFLGWLKALRGSSLAEDLGEFEYLWCQPRHALVNKTYHLKK